MTPVSQHEKLEAMLNSERVRVYVGNRKKPSLAFDLMPGVSLVDALREAVSSMERIRDGKLIAGPSPRTRKPPVDVRELVKNL